MDRITGKGKGGTGIRTNGGIQGVGEESQRRKDLGGLRNIGGGQEKGCFRVMMGAHPKVKEDAVRAKMKIGGTSLREEKEEDRKQR